MNTLEQLLINGLQGKRYEDYVWLINKYLLRYDLLEVEDELYWAPNQDDDYLRNAVEYFAGCSSYWEAMEAIKIHYDPQADFICGGGVSTLYTKELRDLYLEKLFSSEYDETLLCLLEDTDFIQELQDMSAKTNSMLITEEGLDYLRAKFYSDNEKYELFSSLLCEYIAEKDYDSKAAYSQEQIYRALSNAFKNILFSSDLLELTIKDKELLLNSVSCYKDREHREFKERLEVERRIKNRK
jgi:hypothetical protein